MTTTEPQAGLVGAEFRAFWPVHEWLPLPDLIAEATETLPAVTRQAGARIVGPPSWAIVPGVQCPGAGAYRAVLLLRARGQAIQRPSQAHLTLARLALAGEAAKPVPKVRGATEYATCCRCGRERIVAASRRSTGMCRDCYEVEACTRKEKAAA